MKDKRSNYPLRLPADEMKRLKAEAKADGRSVHSYLLQLIKNRKRAA